MRHLFVATLWSLLLSHPLTASATGAPPVPDFNALENQFGAAWQAGQTPLQLLFVDDMGGNKMLRRALEVSDHTCLSDGRLVYVADISGMPGLIARAIALPRMRKLDYPIWLDRNGDATAMLPRQEEGVILQNTGGGDVERFSDGALLLARLLELCGTAVAEEAGAEP
ncbi:hypothetical protein [Pseudomaricurvus sp. HS19]|uniref:hypothetical protein n=1 Tax=Pseudomaricurvus sp. HS19 TaxID=2692626 RepID=UPI00136C0D26|nr:hypothetical protein [Pseudomaricurvus sp. HS19]MYM64403.1 hypothetical protein [Pseudomaricurvus sp. HS19]